MLLIEYVKNVQQPEVDIDFCTESWGATGIYH